MLIGTMSVTIQPNILAQELDGEIVLLNMDSEHYYSLKESGIRMWQLFNQHADVNVVKKLLLDEYEVDETTIQTDLDSFVSWLVAKKLATVSGVANNRDSLNG